MATNKIKIEIGAKDRATAVLRSISKRFKSIGAGMIKIAKVAAVGIAAAFAAVGLAVRKSFMFESITVQFKILLGSMDKAKQRMKELEAFSASTPFQFGDIAKASKTLDLFSNNLLGTAKNLTIFGDAAASTGADIQGVAMWIGRLYSGIKNGTPLGEASMRLMELGILSGEARNELNGLRDAGASNITIWTAFTKSLDKFKGGMDDLSQTGDGLVSTMKDNWTLAVKDFGDSFKDSAKDGIRAVIKWLQMLRKSGKIKEWADTAVRAIDKIKGAIKQAASSEAFKGLIDGLKSAGTFADSVLTAGGASGWGKTLEMMGNVILAALKDGGDYVANSIERAFSGTKLGKFLNFAAAKAGGATPEEAAIFAKGGGVGSSGGDRLEKEKEKFAKFVEESRRKAEETEKQRAETAKTQRAADEKAAKISDDIAKFLDLSLSDEEELTKIKADMLKSQSEIDARLKESADNKASEKSIDAEITRLKKEEANARDQANKDFEKAKKIGAQGVAAWVQDRRDARGALDEEQNANARVRSDVRKARDKQARGIGISNRDQQLIKDADLQKVRVDQALAREANNKKLADKKLEDIENAELMKEHIQKRIMTAAENTEDLLKDNLKEGGPI